MRGAGFSARQRFVLLLMVVAIVVVFGLLAGFAATSIREQGTSSPVDTPAGSLLSTPGALPTGTPGPSPTAGAWSQVQAARLLDQIERQVEILRGLSPQTTVPLNFLDEDGMADLVRGLCVERDVENSLRPYVLLGLLPGAAGAVDVGGVVGLYVPGEEQLYVSIGGFGSGADDRALLAHAYVHALQDQRFGLDAVAARAATTDAALAARALVEGDAMLATALYLYEDLEAADWEHLAALALAAEQPGCGQAPGESDAWLRLRGFPYVEGRRYVEALFRQGGWEAVDRAFADLANSTRAVLYPEQAGAWDGPALVPIPDLGAVLGAGWELALHDVMGEFVAALFLARALPGEAAEGAAEGWVGDAFVVWEDGEGGRVRVWRTMWGDTGEAAEFEGALVAAMPRLALWATPVEPPAGQVGRWWETDAEAVVVSRVARHVVFVRAPDVETLAAVVEALP